MADDISVRCVGLITPGPTERTGRGSDPPNTASAAHEFDTGAARNAPEARKAIAEAAGFVRIWHQD